MDIFGFSGVLSSGHRQLHHSDVILDGTNYIPWKLTIKRILDGTRVLCHVDGTSTTPVAPSIPDSIVSSEASALRIAFEQKMEKWAADDSTAKMIICQTVTLEIRTQIADLPTAHEMWHYLERRYCGSSQAQLYTLYQALTSLQQGEDTVDQFYSRYCALWRQIDALTPSYCAVHAAQILTCSESCSRRRSHDETRRMYEFIMRLRPEFEPTRAQLLHAPSAYSLDEAFAFVRAEETRLRASFTGGGSALAVSRPPLSSTSSSPRPLASLPASSRPPPRSKKIVTCHYCGILGHLERDCRKKQRGFPRNVPHGAPSSAPPLLPLPHTPQVHSVQTSLAPSTSLSATDQQLLAMFRQFQQSHLGDSTGHARSAQVPPSTPGSQWEGDWSWPPP
ncbi:Zinc finger CCHC-type protein [Dioscorea alata]|uniref:Zinc finger CCHC-type protein n=1 Tax=Dioscorea alata TaxID=55571 RepID=A0ACB7U3Z9_DIOAL|nr:Zinc finger CCHC-type protein [Dioscorea alata]